MVKSSIKESRQLRRKLALDGYRLPHGYEIKKCKHSHCGYAIVHKGTGVTIAPMKSKKSKK